MFKIEIPDGKMLVTPYMAKVILEERNTDNRRVKPRCVKTYAKDMKNGNWLDNGERLKINKETGKLEDGQHRLLAVVEANVPVTLEFINIAPNCVGGYDVGCVRTPQDLLHFDNGVDAETKDALSSKTNIATFNMIYKFENYDNPFAINDKISYAELEGAYEKHKDYLSVGVNKNVTKRMGGVTNINRSAIKIALYFAKLSGEDVSKIIPTLYSGIQKTSRDELIVRFRNAISTLGRNEEEKLYYATQWLIWTYFHTNKNTVVGMWNSQNNYYLPEWTAMYKKQNP